MSEVEVDEELAASLTAARKKPHNFAAIAKGQNVVQLIVRKKPIKDAELIQAKKEFQGNAIVKGVVTPGDGPELVFQVPAESPVGEVRLRKFITDRTGLILKTTILIVPDVKEIDEAPQGTGETPVDLSAEWKDKVAAWTPTIKGAIVAAGPSAAEIMKLLAQANALSKPGGDMALAISTLTQCHELATAAQSATPSGSTDSSPPNSIAPPTNSDASPEAKSLLAILSKLSSAIQTAVSAHPTRRGEIVGLATSCKKEIEAEQLDAAKSSLKTLTALLKELGASLSGGGSTETTGTSSTGDESGSNDPLRVWRNAKETCDVGISALQKALKTFDHPDLHRIAELGLNGLTDGMQNRLMAAVMDFRDAVGDGRKTAAAALLKQAAVLRQQLDADDIVTLCEKNPFGVSVAIRAPMAAALTELERMARAG